MLCHLCTVITAHIYLVLQFFWMETSSAFLTHQIIKKRYEQTPIKVSLLIEIVFWIEFLNCNSALRLLCFTLSYNAYSMRGVMVALTLKLLIFSHPSSSHSIENISASAHSHSILLLCLYVVSKYLHSSYIYILEVIYTQIAICLKCVVSCLYETFPYFTFLSMMM